MTYPKKLFILLLLISLLVSGCSGFHNGKFSQDLLPGKESGQILYADDFSNQASGWEVINNAYELKGYSTGGYMISVKQPDSRAVSTTNLNYTDAIISVETQKITGDRQTEFGLVCRFQDKFNFYAFVMSADGYAGIVRVKDGVRELIGSDQLVRVETLEMDDGVNQLTASCEGDSFQLDINGDPIVVAQDNTITNGDAGLFIETYDSADAAVVFNDFVIKKP
jgi:hypothetical protein